MLKLCDFIISKKGFIFFKFDNFRCDGFEKWKYSIQNVDGSSVIRHHGIKTKRTKVAQNIEDVD